MSINAKMSSSVLQFAPFASAVDAGFWWKVSQRKLDLYKLDETPAVVRGYYGIDGPSNFSGVFNVDYTAFDVPFKVRPFCTSGEGSLIAKNTIEEFKECDKKLLIDAVGKEIWLSIVSGDALNNPQLLNRFLLLTYVDLKKYVFYYWFAFPALCHPTNTVLTRPPTPVDQFLNDNQKSEFLKAYDSFVQINDNRGSCFVIHLSNSQTVTVDCLGKFEELFGLPGKVLLGFRDPCTLPNHPGWPLRNLLALVSFYWGEKVTSIDVLCLRDRVNDGIRTISHSLILHLLMTPSKLINGDVPSCVGWELNALQKKAPRKVDLSSSMKPEGLAETSVDLNLKLMRWRLVPSLDLDIIRNSRCLLLGSGTLGCGVARCLLGWGVRRITFVDNGRVSYSNPVRQSLFTFDHCLNGGQSKAQAAADELKRIFPNVESKGIELSIPMPGHFVLDSDIEQIREDVDKLEKLIDENDVIFLLTDTRESRWLPTVIAANQQKLVINAALGFDTFLVMRHGVRMLNDDDCEEHMNTPSRHQTIPGNQLGCYFCNDVVGPGDSTRYRTMDQQCTVTRPGISMIAAAIAVELMVSVLQHPYGGLAPAEIGRDDESNLSSNATTSLGIVPHQIRGFLSQFHNIIPVGRRFDKCTACSNVVVEEYNKKQFDFLLRVFNVPSCLEDLSGLTQLHNETQEAEVWALSDDDDED